jgi:hypothetical protein
MKKLWLKMGRIEFIREQSGMKVRDLETERCKKRWVGSRNFGRFRKNTTVCVAWCKGDVPVDSHWKNIEVGMERHRLTRLERKHD